MKKSSQEAPVRSRFEPRNPQTGALAGGDPWQALLASSADFPAEVFEIAVTQLVHHPEYNSTLILRSEVVKEYTEDFPGHLPEIPGHAIVRCIHRKLLPRRPGRDAGLEQYCTFYRPTEETEDAPVDTLVLTPIVPPGGTLPYYHPTVSHLAFRYVLMEDTPFLQIELVPIPGTPTDPNSRLYRTCLALLETLHRYGWGALVNYKKRVLHDCLIPREEYQDLYLVMRERHKHLIDTWQEVTDPLKHVFEDIGIATFLILLWKNTYGDEGFADEASLSSEPWKSWPRPPGGFVDFGCGNGLLTHILSEEGYDGAGIDVRARTSWEHYPKTTRNNLHVHAFDPLDLEASSQFFKPGAFIIGNHADELTPWVPIVATLTSSSGYLSIPCCPWSFDSKFQRSTAEMYPHPPEMVGQLNLGGDGSNSSAYSVYRIWLASLSLYCGWEVECEMLRIPSTRNWGLVGRKRVADVGIEEARRRANDIIEQVNVRGVFKPRKPEGKAGEH
ncbi:DUF1613 domain-containing protein [Coprinopsis cinerea okayama7|uniref:tRNA (uracil-O(2)-)-methyltransferase n=1 Tax=Coprinopsis cinerea (strain Okayama-7 / 130 / ATCC MYA-4618 / FGSC 9003) TaxID=240176 RepID=A8P8W6_COPC7|nr:DUF1613 domain-containing protein [Coprinopsis cinerea okayama7\|eukprot:XP_001839650.1 DUF1613 domain-containing protein [Coprinopsis cinerea okayama7\